MYQGNREDRTIDLRDYQYTASKFGPSGSKKLPAHPREGFAIYNCRRSASIENLMISSNKILNSDYPGTPARAASSAPRNSPVTKKSNAPILIIILDLFVPFFNADSNFDLLFQKNLIVRLRTRLFSNSSRYFYQLTKDRNFVLAMIGIEEYFSH